MQAQDSEQQQRSRQAEEHEGDCVLLAYHLLLGIDAAERVDKTLDRAQRRVKPGPLTSKDARQVAADRFDQHEHDEQKAYV